MQNEPEILDGPTEVPSEDSRYRVFVYSVKHGDIVQDVAVEVSANLMSSEPGNPHFAAIVTTKGRSLLERSLAEHSRIPPRLRIAYATRTFGE
jgi:hypothetical protein